MVAPVAKGVIIAASVIVAAGIAIYENPQVRQWVDQRRRKIAHALHHIGENNNRRPRSASSQQGGDPEELRRRKARNELVKKAREEGVAVDLDELSRAGSDEPSEKKTHQRGLSFDDFVHNDGTLRQTDSTVTEKATTTATDSGAFQGMKQRGTGARGFFEGSTYANPFGDEAQVLFDRDLVGTEDASVDGSHVDDDAEEASVPSTFDTTDPSRKSSVTLEGSASPLEQSHLIDLTEPFAPPFQQAAAPAGAASEHATEPESTASFHSFASDASEPAAAAPMTSSAQPSDFISDADSDSDSDSLVQSTGTLTPTDDGFSNVGSVVGSGAEDYAAHEDARSEAAFSETGYSEISAGVHTPSSWSDIGSDAGSDYGSSNGNGHH
ncbi:uncharacterized protein K452DRAFT_329515 [Aplosporella prunicola CBS 121167]|uniref:Uncharacterized protein n=1 Tax=Aplosporella prunicola CBS 121167 TaxID=1176127 RepID=A0A6A6B1D8_9PEZI|nr:uncharacterized protein K452DRAFT_329515 [Aplosporella prunicola CBS 121167]KAF2136837.1 hypothetical protein K452DRAFT_329515 [Aplosporella prunicola CBS 121167]